MQTDRSFSIVILKEDIETRDDLKLAMLEIRGLSGKDVQSINEFDTAIDPTLLDHARQLSLDDSHIFVAPGPLDAGVFAARAGLFSHMLTSINDEVSVVATRQTEFERSTGASGAKAVNLAGLSRKKNEYLSHAFHKYKAKFFPRMARALSNYTVPSEGHILDPFMGSGTLSVEASLMGLNAYGIDVDPLSVEMAVLKTDALRIPVAEIRKANEHFHYYASLDANSTTLWDDFQPTEVSYTLPKFIRRKISPEAESQEIEREACIALGAIATCPSDEGRRFLRIALSHALATRVTLRWMGTGDNRFALELGKRPMLRVMSQHLSKMQTALEQRDLLASSGAIDLGRLGTSLITRGDVRALPYADETFDGIVTSPPYLPAASGRETYLRSRACSLTALGLMTEAEILQRETEMVGSILRSAPARSHGLPPSISELVEWMEPQRARKPKALATSAYFLDIAQSLREMARVTKPGGKIALVVSAEHVFYGLVSREVVRRLDMPGAIEEIVSDETNGVALKIDEVAKIQLPKMDFAARPASKGDYSEAVVLATRI